MQASPQLRLDHCDVETECFLTGRKCAAEFSHIGADAAGGQAQKARVERDLENIIGGMWFAMHHIGN